MRIDRRSFLQSVLGACAVIAAPSQKVGASTATPLASPVAVPGSLPDEDGYDLWLRYRPVADTKLLANYRSATAQIVQLAADPIAQSITAELDRACKGMLNQSPIPSKSVTADGTILIGSPKNSKSIRDAVDASRLSSLGNEGFVLKTHSIDGHATIIVAANSDRGLLYGTFALIKQMQLRNPIDSLDVTDAPQANIRLVNHWDDLDRTVARGYAGLSIFHFSDLTVPNPRYEDYARILASLGINGSVINDVNATPEFLDSKMIPGYASLAEIFRNWGIQLFLSVNFASPIQLTANDPSPITTADPLDKHVQDWWAKKVDEIYTAVPDFGGFLVKANSEGDPGPLTYNRTHAEGANMLAAPLKPHNGILMWRSFVHKGFKGWAKYEYDTFQPLDGKFDSNVIVQTKNGPIDFQAQEPVNPLLGAMPKTNQMIELQATQEYTGHATHLCYLPTYWSRILGFETHYSGTGPTVAEIVDGTADKQSMTGFAGVINLGDDRNWTGSYLAAANTSGFGRLAWNHSLDTTDIAKEWTALSFGPDEQVISTLSSILGSSWDTFVDYTSPFGTGYLVRPTGPHFSPDPNATLHLSHHTDSHGSGYDRTLATGSGFTRLYSDYWFDQYEHLDSCPEDLLMFMHIVPWEHKLANGQTTIQQMYIEYFTGVDDVRAMRAAWQTLDGRIDQQRFWSISRQFDQQVFQSRLWRDVMVSFYFDYARTVSTNNPWVQLESKGDLALLFGGSANDVSFLLTNATGQAQTLSVAIDPSLKGWTSNTVKKELKSTESKDGGFSITPPLDPYLGPVRFSCDPATLTRIGFETQAVVVTPDAKQCSFSLDIGSKPDSVVSGYTSMTSADIWSSSSKAGWVGKPPLDVWRGKHWGPLQNHFATGGAPHTLRLQVPAGSQRAWALIGGEGSGTQPVQISSGSEKLVETLYLPEGQFQWAGFTLDGGKGGKTVDLTIEGSDGRQWRLGALVVLKPGL